MRFIPVDSMIRFKFPISLMFIIVLFFAGFTVSVTFMKVFFRLGYLTLRAKFHFAFDCLDAQMLSTALGQGRPAFSARALADAFCPEDRGVDFFFGFFFSHIGLLAIFLMPIFCGFNACFNSFSASLFS